MVWGLLGVEKAYANRVYPGVWVQAQPLTGLTHQQTVDRLDPIHKAMLLQKVALILNDRRFEPTLSDLGYKVDTAAMAATALKLGRGSSLKDSLISLIDYQRDRTIPILYDIDQQKFDNYLNEISREVAKDSRDLSLTYANGAIGITPAEEGIALDREAIRRAVQQQAKPGESAIIRLTLTPSQPLIKEERQVTAAKEELTKLLARPLNLQAGEIVESWTPEIIFSLVYFTPNEQQELMVNFDENKTRDLVAKLAKKVDITAVAKHISAVNQQVVQEGRDGRQLDVADASARIIGRLEAGDLEAPLILSVKTIDRQVATVSPEFTTGRFAGRYVEIDLSAQRLHFIEGDNYHRTAIISTGKWDTPTPIGDFEILNHIETAWSKRYGLYMPKWMGLKKAEGTYEGYGMHGLPYWPNGRREGKNHLGRPVSHGCIRLGEEDIAYLYDWAPNGTPVVIHQ